VVQPIEPGLRAPNKQTAEDAERAARATQRTLTETWHSPATILAVQSKTRRGGAAAQDATVRVAVPLNSFSAYAQTARSA